MSFWPNGSSTRPAISSPFGPRKVITPGMSAFHEGIDSYGYTVNHAVTGGTVVFAGYNGGAGYEVRWNGDDGREHRDLHHVAGSLRVAKGQRIERGTPLGLQGRTGTATGVHNHHGVRVGGKFVDPMPILTALPSSSAPAGDGTTPLDNTTRKARPMYSVIPIVGTGGSFVCSLITGLMTGIQSPYHRSLLFRVRDNNDGDPMLPGEIEIVRGYLVQINPPANVQAAQIDYAKLQALIDAANEDDTEKILGALSAISVKAGATPAEIAAEVDKVLAGDFAAVPKSVIDLQVARLAA